MLEARIVLEKIKERPGVKRRKESGFLRVRPYPANPQLGKRRPEGFSYSKEQQQIKADAGVVQGEDQAASQAGSQCGHLCCVLLAGNLPACLRNAAEAK